MDQFLLLFTATATDWSHRDFFTPLLFVFVWAVTMVKSGGLKPHLPLSYRIQNVCLSFYLVSMASLNVNLILWCVFHPGSVPKYFYVSSGPFPPVVTLLILLLSFCAVVLDIKLGFLMAQQRQRARTLGLRLIPYLVSVGILDAMRVLSKHADERNFTGLALVTILFVLAPYVWLYFFLRSKKTEAAMTNIR